MAGSKVESKQDRNAFTRAVQAALVIRPNKDNDTENHLNVPN